jgi:hypothetical protein
MDLAPLTQLLRDFHSILSVADDFQPFDYDTAEESSIAAGMPGNEAPPVRRASRSPEQTKQLLLADIERLRERLQARVDALTKQAKYVRMRMLCAGCGARGVRLTSLLSGMVQRRERHPVHIRQFHAAAAFLELCAPAVAVRAGLALYAANARPAEGDLVEAHRRLDGELDRRHRAAAQAGSASLPHPIFLVRNTRHDQTTQRALRVLGVRLTHSQHLQQVSAACVLCVPAA